MLASETCWTAASWPAPANIKAGTTTRIPGCSQPPFDSFNLAMHVGDAAQDIVQNRSDLIEILNLPSEPVWLQQIHSGNAVQYRKGMVSPRADAMYTNLQGIVCVVLTADCIPILLCASSGQEIAVVHAGWRGLNKGIITNALKEFSADPGEIMAWIGPGISREHYEVGDDVRQAFKGLPAAVLDECFTPADQNKWLADLAGLATAELKSAGLTGVYHSGHCTYRDSSRYFSYRREKKTGRMASLIWIDHG